MNKKSYKSKLKNVNLLRLKIKKKLIRIKIKKELRWRKTYLNPRNIG